MAFRLPPLSSLRVFEAAARHLSFRKAADELNLTASAVSHAVQTLENWLGVELFQRVPRGLRLTDAGDAYLPLVHQALSLIAKATDQLPGRKPTGMLSISSAPTFAGKILLPRLADFTAAHPNVRLTIDSSHRLVDLAIDDFDLAIRFMSAENPAPNWTLLMGETLEPVCGAELQRAFAGRPIEDVLARAPLIHVTTVSADWPQWFRANGMEAPAPVDGELRVDTMQMAFDAAIRGLGVVLGRRPLIDADIEAGRLVALGGRAVPSGSAYWLITAETEFEKPEVKLFRQWLLTELGHAPAPRKPRR
jgi:LysR family transcriptional regulator, glycine cleavage system transcriptional activator